MRITSIIYIVFLYCSFSCQEKKQYNYPKDRAISNQSGEPQDSLIFYFPSKIKLGDKMIQIEMDTFLNTMYSTILYTSKEPILYNYYLNRNIYRLILIPSQIDPIIISLNKEDNKIWLTTKRFVKEPPFLGKKLRIISLKKSLQKGHIDFETYTSLIAKKDEISINSPFFEEQKRFLSHQEWDELNKRINESFFLKQLPIESNNDGMDGTQWILEVHSESLYWFVDRWEPQEGDAIYSIGKYLIKLSSVDLDSIVGFIRWFR